MKLTVKLEIHRCEAHEVHQKQSQPPKVSREASTPKSTEVKVRSSVEDHIYDLFHKFLY